MDKKTVTVRVEYSGKNLSAYIDGAPIITVGKDLEEIKSNIVEAVDLYKEICIETGVQIVDILNGELKYIYKLS